MEETSKDGVENASAGQKSITLPGPGTKPRPVPRPRNQTKAATIAENGKPGVAHSLPSSKPVLPPKPRRQPPNAPCEKPPSDAANNNEVLLTKKPATSTVKPTLIPGASRGSLKSNGFPTTTTDTISNGPELVDCADSTDQMYEPLKPRTESPSSSSDDGYEDITIPETRKETPPGYEDITIPETRKETTPPARRAEKRSPPVPRKTSGASDKPSPPLPRKTSGAVDKPSPPFPRKISGTTEKQSPPLPCHKVSTKAEKTSPSSHRKLSISPPTARKLSATRQQEACSVASVTSSGRTLDSNTGVGKSKPLPPKKPLPSLPKGTVLAAKEVISSKPPLPNKPPSPKTEHSQTSVAALAQKLSTIPVFPFRDSDGGKGGSSPRSSPISSPKPSPRGIPSSSLSGKKDSPNVASSPGSSESTRPKLLPKPGTGERSPSQPTPSQSAHCTTGHDIHKQPPARPTPPSAVALSRARSRTIESLEDKESQQTDSTQSGAKGFVRKSSHPERKKKLGSRLKSLRPGSAATSTQSQQSQRRAPPLPPGAVPMLDLKGVSLKVPPVPVGPRPRPSSEYEDGRRSHMKNSVSKSVSVGDLPRVTAEDQSEYSYAYEHTLLGRSPPTGGLSLRNPAPRLICDSDRPICESDSTYVDPDQSIVSEFMEDIHHKHAPVSYEEADEQTVAGFMDSISKTQTLSGLPAVLSSDESDSESSDDAHEYLVPPVEYNEEDDDDEEDDDASSENSFSSESSDDYCEPPESTSPPEPPAHVDSYDVSEEGIYMEPFHKSAGEVFSSDDDKESVSEEPLYQVYNANTLRRERNLSRRRLNSDVSLNDEASLEELTRGTLRNMRMLWGELPEVKASGILDIIKPEERKRQEAMFEVITSEASYLRSLNILMSHFLNSDELSAGSSLCTLERGQSHVLFSNISSIKAVSESFLQAVRARQKEAVVISSISDIIEDHATKFFEVYVKYCSNQIYQDRALKNLRKNVKFIEAVAKLESNKKAQGLTLQSFLVLPMQRITRLPLLVNAICHRCEPGSDEFHTTDRALAAINKIVNDCNEGARKMERMEEMCLLQTQIEFKTKPLALATSSRYLLRKGDLTFVVEDSRSPLKRGKPKQKPLYMFLFNDLLLLTKKKSENRFQALDYATRNMTQVEEPRDPDTVNIEHMFSLVLLENSEGKTKEFLLVGNSETDKTRWMGAFKPPAAEQEGETVYGSWDCPQVNALHNYTAQQPDELSLHEGDVINVLKKLRDGWYHGERLCDGSQGWFPANHTEEIVNEHVRARNLRQRYRLLAASMHLIGGTLRA